MDFDEIINKAKNKDEDAFKTIVDTYKNYVFAIILNFISDEKEAENIAQEVFLQIYLSLNKYREGSFKSWISKITSNKTIDYIRNKNVHFKEEPAGDKDYIFTRKESSTPEADLLKLERNNKLIEKCKMLPEIYYNVLIDFYVYDKTYGEIGRTYGISEKTVGSRLYRAKQMLREKWGD